MTKRLIQIWTIINMVLTRINICLAILAFGAGVPKKYENRKIPLVANVVLLVILVAVLFIYIRSYSSSGHQPSQFS